MDTVLGSMNPRPDSMDPRIGSMDPRLLYLTNFTSTLDFYISYRFDNCIMHKYAIYTKIMQLQS